MTVISSSDRALGETLSAIVEAAGRVILPYWRSDLTVSHKADESPVTEADRRGEAFILEALAKHFPDIPVVSEEDSSEFGAPKAVGPRFFLVDPLDGTKAFVRGDENFTVNIGLIQDGCPVAGAVGAPALNALWWTGAAGAMRRRGGGAAEAIRVRPWPEKDVLALASHTLAEDQAERLRAQYGFAALRRLDSSIKLCRIAEGAADIYPRHGPTMEWDIAAAQAVLEAAGGSLRTPQGEAFTYGKADQGFRNGWFVARGG